MKLELNRRKKNNRKWQERDRERENRSEDSNFSKLKKHIKPKM